NNDAPANIGALSTLRGGGVSPPPYDDGEGKGGLNLGVHVGDDLERVRQNRALLRAFVPAEPAWLSQVHGVKVVDAATVEHAPEADASIATAPGVVCAIQTADCLPALFCDTPGRVVGAAHAGWRGLAGGVLENTVSHMRDAGAGEILAWLGPAIGPQCFEVGQDVFDAFVARDAGLSAAFRPIAGQPGKYLADIYALARAALGNIGVTRVFGGGLCTVTDRPRFYSYRRDKRTGRMASLIWLK
ncbi:MAG: peptidoglycan editing factor PgeF, partial [Noviherbaspirillum sp.]